MSDKADSSGMDIIKVYIWGMAALTLITFVWLLINYFSLGTYQDKYSEGEDELEEIVDKEKELVKLLQNQTEVGEIDNAYSFFTRTVRGISDTPELSIKHWSPQSEGSANFEEKSFTISFKKGVTRNQLARYIYTIQNEKSFLRVKELKLWKKEDSRAHQDSWTADIVFAMRRPKK